MLKCTIRSFTTPKFGNSVDENEDSILIPNKTEDILLRFAISDGATESSFSKEWAELLVKGYKDKSFDKHDLPETIKQISKSWKILTWSKDLAWYAQQKLETGAF